MVDQSEQLRELVLLGIMTGTYGPDHKFDERAIGKDQSMTRLAVRAALSDLTESGVLVREPRSGTRSQHDLTLFETNEMTMRSSVRSGIKNWRTESIEKVSAPAPIARDLEVDSGSPVTVIHRMTMLGTAVSASWTIWTAHEIPPEFMQNGFPTHLNWYAVAAVLTGERDFSVDRMSTVFSAAAADAERLEIEAGTPVTFNARLTRTLSGRPVDRSFGRWGTARMVTHDHTTVNVSEFR